MAVVVALNISVSRLRGLGVDVSQMLRRVCVCAISQMPDLVLTPLLPVPWRPHVSFLMHRGANYGAL